MAKTKAKEQSQGALAVSEADGMTASGDLIDIKYGDPFVQMVERLATNEAVDADKLEKLVDIQMRIMDRRAEAEFNAAMADVQANLPKVATEAQNDQTNSRYARHEAISAAIKPIYTERGFSTSFSQGKAEVEGHIRIAGVLRHRAGHRADYFIDLPTDKTGIQGRVNKTDLHAAGSTFTYGRRYLTCLMFDVATGDDTDGVTASPVLTDEEQTALYAKCVEMFGEHRTVKILNNLASQYFRIKDGDWHKIPSYRFEEGIRKLREKWDGEQPENENQDREVTHEIDSRTN